MDEFFQEGVIVISCETGQAGTVIHMEGLEVSVLFRNMEMWHGPTNRIRRPQNEADLAAAPLNVKREVKLERVSRQS